MSKPMPYRDDHDTGASAEPAPDQTRSAQPACRRVPELARRPYQDVIGYPERPLQGRPLLALLVVATFLLACSSASGAVTVGVKAVGTEVETNVPGRAQDYRLTASETGSVNRLNVYLDRTNTADRVELGVYSGARRTLPGPRRRRCVITNPRPGWNSCTVAAVRVLHGRTYWLAILHPFGGRGTIRFRDRSGRSRTFGSASARLSRLRTSWSNGPDRGSQRASVYADRAARPAPSPKPSPRPSPPGPVASPEPSPSPPGPVVSPEPSPNPPRTGSPFPIGVWMQDPTENGQAYKDIGINVFIGIWNFPSDQDMYPGWSLNAMSALKSLGLSAIAGTDTSWIREHADFAATLRGYLLGDEPDLAKTTGETWAQPDSWRSDGWAIRNADPTRDVYANMGMGFCAFPWYYDGNEFTDFPKYLDPLTITSCDYYGLTDPAPPYGSDNSVWAYGYGIDNMKRWSGSKPIWGFLEGSAPRPVPSWFAPQRMPPEKIDPIVWLMIIHGADGIQYFCHDFSAGYMVRDDGCLYDPGIPAAMKATNASVQKHADVLQTPDVGGTTASSTGRVPITTLTKKVDRRTYVFAIGDGAQSIPDGESVDGTITVSGAGDGAVVVLDEGRTISMSHGQFTDHFAPYQHHIYRID
jgi:hypothetical protein